MKSTNLKHFLSFLLVVISSCLHAQVRRDAEYRDILNTIYKSKSIVAKSKIDDFYYKNVRTEDKANQAWANYLYATLYKKDEDFKETFRYANLTSQYAKNNDDEILLILSNEMIAWVYYNMDWYKQSRELLDENFRLVNEVKDQREKNYLFFKTAYRKAGLIREENGPLDSVIYYYKSGIKHINRNLAEETDRLVIYENLSSLYDNLGYAYLTKNQDSASYYFFKGKEYVTDHNKVRNAIIDLHLADIETNKGEILKAKNLITNSIPELLDSEHKFLATFAYKKLAELSKKLGENREEILATEKYIIYKDSLDIKKKKSVHLALDYIQNEGQEKEYTFPNIYIYLGVLGLMFLIILYLIYDNRKQKKSRNNIEEILRNIHQNNINTKTKIIKEEIKTDDDSNDLKNKTLNAMFQKNIIFREYFNQLHPGFEQRLLEKEPSLKRADLDFCYYLRMNLSTKDIEHVADIKTKAVEYRKYKLRKLFQLDSKEDLYQWINQI